MSSLPQLSEQGALKVGDQKEDTLLHTLDGSHMVHLLYDYVG
ncbi:hypothetical protein [Vibrio sp. Of7-15]|nr:hypothetical protein [Vibrio sp. Of7-15]